MSVTPPSRLYILLLGTITALPPLSIDMGLPALDQIGQALGVSTSLAAQSLSIFVLGFSLGPLWFGPWSDRIGRKPVLLGGLAVFAFAGMGCASASNITTLLACRFVQGCGAGAAGALPMAIVRDHFGGDHARKLQSHLATVNSLGPLVAPMLGSIILLLANWRGIYALLTGAGILLWLASRAMYTETRHAAARAGSARSLRHAYASVLRDRRFVLASLLVALNFGGMFAYITASPLVFMSYLGLSSLDFAFLFALTALGTLSGSALNSRLIDRGIPAHRIMLVAVTTSAAASLALLGVAAITPHALVAIVLLVLMSNLCTGLLIPNANHAALENLAHGAGTGAALLRGGQMLAGSISSIAVGTFYNGHGATAMAVVMSICALTALACFRFGLLRLLSERSSDKDLSTAARAAAED